MSEDKKIHFILKNVMRGLIYTLIIAAIFLLFKEFFIDSNKELWLERFYSNPTLIYLIYTGSEIFFGIIPPEFFMIWAYNKADFIHYLINLGFFAGVSYGAGVLGFLIGRFLRRVVFFRYMSSKFLKNYWSLFRKFGSVLIIIAALTPLPWAAISILVGSTEYPFKKYLNFALFRILRFIIYGYIIFQTHQF